MLEVDENEHPQFKASLTEIDPLDLKRQKTKGHEKSLFEQRIFIKETVKEIKKKQMAKTYSMTPRELIQSRKKHEEQIFLRSENKIDFEELKLLSKQEK